MESIEDPYVAAAFHSYPLEARRSLLRLRLLVLEAALETEGVGQIEEALRWGEPSYLTKTGSTVRLGWKESQPDRYAVYFHCRTSLVDTFRELYGDKFTFDGNRAMLFEVGESVPERELKHCFSLALSYHRVKHLPMLGA